MASDKDRLDFSRRGSWRPQTIPVKTLPKFSETIHIRRPEDKVKWVEMDNQLDAWRKTLQLQAQQAAALAAPTETTTQQTIVVQQAQQQQQAEPSKHEDLLMESIGDGVSYLVKIRENIDGILEWFLSPRVWYLKNISDNKPYEVFIRSNPDGIPELTPGAEVTDIVFDATNKWEQLLDQLVVRFLPSNAKYAIKLRNNSESIPELFIAGPA